MDTTINVRFKDVWPNPVELVNVPTILVDMSEEQKQAYEHMKESFEKSNRSSERYTRRRKIVAFLYSYR